MKTLPPAQRRLEKKREAFEHAGSSHLAYQIRYRGNAPCHQITTRGRMKAITLLALAGAFFLSHQVHAAVQTPTPPAQQQLIPTAVRSSEALTFVSQFNHEAYRVDIYIPRGTPPPEGYPALYVRDGDIIFSTFADAIRNKSKSREIELAVVVGISGADSPNGANCMHNFTYADLSTVENPLW